MTGIWPEAKKWEIWTSTLVDDLLARGYSKLTVLDVSQAAIAASRKRLGDTAEHVRWLVTNLPS